MKDIEGEIHLRLLGDLQIVSGQELPLAVSARKCKALLAVLARPPGQRHTREKLATLLWPDAADGQARANLRQALRSLRKLLPEPGVVSEGDVVFLDATGMTVDVVLFDRLVEEGTPAALAEAVALYRGEFLEGLVLREEAFLEWVDAERAELRERAGAAMSALLDHYAETARNDQAVQIARRLLTLDPLQEEIQRRLIQLYAQQGRRSATVEQYRRCRDILRRERVLVRSQKRKNCIGASATR